MQPNIGDLSEATIRKGLWQMAEYLANGRRIVVGVSRAMEEGFIIGKDGERQIAIKRRATRQEFLDAIPPAEDRAEIEAMRAPFYYELELWDRVLEGADGIRLGIRIRQGGF